MGVSLPRPTGSVAVCAALWVVALSWLIFDQAGEHREVYRLMLATAIASTVVAAVDRHARQLAEIAALSYRAGTAATLRESRLVGGDMPAEPQGG